MKNKLTLSWFITILGSFLLVSGIVLGAVGADVLNIPFDRLDLVPIAVGGCGFMLLFGGVMVILDNKYKTKEDIIEENDERNIVIKQKAKSKAFDLMVVMFCLGLLTLTLFGYMNEVSFFSLIGLYLLSVFYYGYQLVLNKKAM
ncbi:hypothetical protein KIS4809_2150 [Bacillus sp. ZZV12-4809]|nr:hypothetical protein KIS4809_2150 [Bacillus sp. ZZV12-4809]